MKYFIVVLLLSLSLKSSSQYQIGKETLNTFNVGSYNFKYLSYTPDGYITSGINYPVVVFFYGVNVTPSYQDRNNVWHLRTTEDNDSLLIGQGISDQIEHNGFKPNFICIQLQVPLFNIQSDGWAYGNPAMVDNALKNILPKYRIDKNKIILTGLSAGGVPVFMYPAATNTLYKISAIVPMSAATSIASVNVAQIIKNKVHVWGFGGGTDIHGIHTQEICTAIGSSLAKYSDVLPGHSGWDKIYNQNYKENNQNIYQWSEQFSTTTPDTTIIQPSSNWIYPSKLADGSINLNTLNVPPGSVIAISAKLNPITYINWDYHKGDTTRPDTIINVDGQVKLFNTYSSSVEGIRLRGCTAVKVLGNGTSDKYGFSITSKDTGGSGLTAYELTNGIEFRRIEVNAVGVGIWIKQEADCADSLSWHYPNGYINGVTIDSNYIHNTKLEGMYLGSTDPNNLPKSDPLSAFNQHGPLICNGDTLYNKPLRLRSFKIYGNIIDKTGRSGIGLSDHDGDTALVYDNNITNCGSEAGNGGWQASGIQAGSYTYADFYGNNIDYTGAAGIQDFASYAKIHGNTVNHSGYLGSQVNKGAANILVDNRPQPIGKFGGTDSCKFDIFDNKLGLNTDFNIRLYNSWNLFTKRGNRLVNSGNWYAAQGMSFDTGGTVTPPPPIDSTVLSHAWQGSDTLIITRTDKVITFLHVQRLEISNKRRYRVVFINKQSIIVGYSK